MSDIVALPEAQAEDLSPFLDGDAKQQIIDAQHGFLITAARPHVASTQPQFKDQVMYEIAFFVPGALSYLEQQGKAENGQVKTAAGALVDATAPDWAANSKRWMLALQHNKTREGQAQKIAEILATGAVMVGPCWMSEIPNDTPGFNPTRIIIGNPKPVAAKPKKTNGAAPANPVDIDGDSIPFRAFDPFTVS